MIAERTSLRAKSIAVVGAGPSGVVAAKYLRAEKAFDRIVLFEQRSRSGGIWNYTGDQRDEDLFTVPQTNPRGKNQDPKWVDPNNPGDSHALESGRNAGLSFLSPMYEKLETNIPRGLMGIQDLDWPQDSQLFPTHDTVLKYIDDYGKDVQDMVQCETQVVNAEPTNDAPDSTWTVRTRNLRTNKEHDDIFDAVIVANGHFIVPYIPHIPSIREWNTQYPGAISHSKYYRRPEEYSGMKVIVVGNSASGADISNQIAPYCQEPLLWSSRSTSMFAASHGAAGPERREVPPIARFTPSNRGVEFEDGTTESDIDAIVFATGYFYSLPFLENVKPALITDGSHVNNTYQHLFFAPQPTLSFLALNQRVIPFPFAEAQASVLARVYSGRLTLPSYTEMQKWEQDAIAESGDGRNFHLLKFPKDGNYINAMSQRAMSASTKDGLENEGNGKLPPVWGEWEFWCRENFPAIRKAFTGLGEKRKEVRSLEELGFSFEEWKREKEREEGKLI
ncbi:FAD/NAD(P)-binding domain-containing protein [Ophiobolus disseminans]|uniref:FAD/NAD(P)-binding domain-containing protein n=1 Tax=Ophiobolus disseminans TaxID=1469910 RepID=A0A6A7A182_9PLEO|nr:FAD/NAD(P)-binding domain-containing protein [Ophiobolus disseminans]